VATSCSVSNGRQPVSAGRQSSRPDGKVVKKTAGLMGSLFFPESGELTESLFFSRSFDFAMFFDYTSVKAEPFIAILPLSFE
jgi:hypothetical protein